MTDEIKYASICPYCGVLNSMNESDCSACGICLPMEHVLGFGILNEGQIIGTMTDLKLKPTCLLEELGLAAFRVIVRE